MSREIDHADYLAHELGMIRLDAGWEWILDQLAQHAKAEGRFELQHRLDVLSVRSREEAW